MVNLQQTSGLPIELTDDFKLKFNPPMKEFPMTFARKFEDMIPVLLDQNVKSDLVETYFVYRGLCLPEHEEFLKQKNLTYDVTIVPPAMLGQELNKTVGHYHANIPETEIAHPEMYEVLEGHGLFLIQKMDNEFKKVLDVIAFEAKAGDKIIYPPNYGHILINIGDTPLVVANWLSLDYKPLYKEITDFKGMDYYVIRALNRPYLFIENEKYAEHPPMKLLNKAEVIASTFGFIKDEPMYITAMKNPEKLEFLSNPAKYSEQLSILTA